jgi:hypothetical protein
MKQARTKFVLNLRRGFQNAPLDNAGAVHLNVQALKLKLHRTGPGCGPHEITPGQFVHIDCGNYTPVKNAKPFNPRKLHMLMAGSLRLDSAIGRPGAPGSDRASPINAGAGQLPDSVDHRKDGTEGPIKDQGAVGSCTSFSLSSAMDNAIRRQNKQDTTSSLHIWSHYGYPNMQYAGDDNVNKPIATWGTWPYDERVACELDTTHDCGPYNPPVPAGGASGDPQLQSKIHDSDSKGAWVISEYDEITADADTIAAMLASGSDVWFSMRVGSTWMKPNGDTIADWTEQQVEGGHAVLFAGYRHVNNNRQFLVHNSWGPKWGDGGFAYISEHALTQFIKHAYKVVVQDKSGPPPPPNNPNALTDDDCSETQLVDAVTGQCADMCSDDSRPSNGQCP